MVYFFFYGYTPSHNTQHTYYIYLLHTGYTFTHSFFFFFFAAQTKKKNSNRLHSHSLILFCSTNKKKTVTGYMFSLSWLHVLRLHVYSLILSRSMNKKKNSKLLHLLSFNNLVKQFISQI